MKRKIRLLLICTVIALIVFPFTGCKKKTPEGTSDPEVGELKGGDALKVPLIAWGADIITIHANGKNSKTVKGSLFDEAGLSIDLFREDDFNRQVDMYMKGDTVFLRGTMGMLNMALDKLGTSAAAQPVLFFCFHGQQG
jgi:hypothetical protein